MTSKMQKMQSRHKFYSKCSSLFVFYSIFASKNINNFI
jgi:hypothetical protein